MNATAYDWNDLTKLFRIPKPEKHGFCVWNREKNQIEYHCVKGNVLRPVEDFQFPMEQINVEAEIQKSLPLQFALLETAVYWSTRGEIMSPDLSDTDKFRETMEVMLRCYREVRASYQAGTGISITGTHVFPEVKESFQRLLHSKKLHSCISLLASRAPLEPRMDSPLTLYEVQNPASNPCDVTKSTREFAAFLKIRRKQSGDIASFPLYGYSFSELAQNTAVNLILSQFSRSFYIEETGTKRSYGFYLV
ncbi:MAG: hypothetical protein LKJ17_05555 [Oscillospiraceae bacterium]|jgi:hypothetical protein|nr:hypothetical protein [Oscillospiraceae bacterium]